MVFCVPKPQVGGFGCPSWFIYGIRLLAKQFLGTFLDIEVDQSCPDDVEILQASTPAVVRENLELDELFLHSGNLQLQLFYRKGSWLCVLPPVGQIARENNRPVSSWGLIWYGDSEHFNIYVRTILFRLSDWKPIWYFLHLRAVMRKYFSIIKLSTTLIFLPTWTPWWIGGIAECFSVISCQKRTCSRGRGQSILLSRGSR